MEQEGYTNLVGNQWIRAEEDKANDDNPSPKKLKSGGGFQNNDSEAGPSKFQNQGKNKQVDDAGQHEGMEKDKNDNEDSADEGLFMGDLCPPGAESHTFGSFSHVEIRKLNCIYFNDGKPTVIDEYGSNIHGYKFDPLAAIEAKRAMFNAGKSCHVNTGNQNTRKDLSPVMEEGERVTKERVVSLHGTQEPPNIGSSQKDYGDYQVGRKKSSSTRIVWIKNRGLAMKRILIFGMIYGVDLYPGGRGFLNCSRFALTKIVLW